MTNKNNPKPLKSDDVPATKAHLELVRQELKSDITSLSLSMDAKFSSVDSKFSSLDSRFSNIDSKFISIDSKFISIDSKFSNIDSKFEKITSILFEMKALIEEQNSRNRIVLDGYAHLFDKSLISDQKIANLEKKVFGASQK